MKKTVLKIVGVVLAVLLALGIVVALVLAGIDGFLTRLFGNMNIVTEQEYTEPPTSLWDPEDPPLDDETDFDKLIEELEKLEQQTKEEQEQQSKAE